MKRYLKASVSGDGLSDKEMLEIMEPIQKDIAKRCEERGKGEYVDDVQWGPYGFKIPVFINPYPNKPNYVANVANFTFHYRPDDEDYTADEQAHVQYDEFIQSWDYEDEDDDEEMTHEEFIQDCLEDEVYEAWQMNKSGQLAEEDVIHFVKTRLINDNYGFEYGEDFTADDIRDAMDDYFWD